MSILEDIDPDANYTHNDALCSYYGCRLFKSSFAGDTASLRLLHFNCRSAKKNLDEFLILLYRLGVEFHIIILTETWLNSEQDWNEMPGYTAYHSIKE